MTMPLTPETEDLEEIAQGWPKTIDGAVSLLSTELVQEVKDKIAALPEGELGTLDFGLGRSHPPFQRGINP